MSKLIAMGLTSVLGIGLAGLFQGPLPPPGGGPPPPEAKGKTGAPGDELRKTYDLLRRVRSDSGTGRTEERINDWTDRATSLYRRAIRTREEGDLRRARELGTAAHDLARAVDHARNAARLDRPDPDLPPPPDGFGPEDIDDLPYLPLYLGEKGLTDSAIGIISTLAALSALAQFPVGLWSDRIGWRKPFLVVALAVTALATLLIRGAHSVVWLGVLVVLFAENGIGRAVVESFSGAEVAALASKGGVGMALGALRFWKPIGIVLVAMVGSWLSERYGIGAILLPLAVVQGLAVGAALLIHEGPGGRTGFDGDGGVTFQGADGKPANGWFPKDAGLWAFVAAMVLFHAANAPGGVYLGLFLKRDLHAPERMLAYAFVVSMTAWMLVVWPAGWLADRYGRKPLLVAGWTVMAVRLGLVSLVHTPWLAVVNQALDGLGNGLFAVMAAAWVTDRLADPRRSGEAQVIVGSCLVLGSALGPAVASFLVGPLGYRGLFAALAALGALATSIVAFFVPESLASHDELIDGRMIDPMATTSDLSTVP